jgi:hypothetical protein
MSFLSIQEPDSQNQILVISKISADLVSLNSGNATGKAKIKFETKPIETEKIIPFNSVDEAETYVLENGNVFYSMSTPPLNHVEVDARLAHRISIAKANIAANSRRGMGNTIICHPNLMDKVNNCWNKIKSVMVYNPLTEQSELVEQLYFSNGPLQVYTTPNAPEDQVLVLYRGEKDTDQPLIYIPGSGLYLNSALSDVESYGKFVRIP